MISNLKSEKENQEYLKSVIGNRGKSIDWKNSIGCEIKYKYDWNGYCSEGVLKIVGYEGKIQKVYFDKGYGKGIKTSDLTRGKLGGILGYKSSEFKYDIGTITIKELLLTDREYRYDKKGQKWKYYKYKCNKCGNEDWMQEGHLKENGCNVCSGQKAVLGFNTIYDLVPWMIDLGVSEQDAKTHTPCSGKKIIVKCTDCGKTKEIRISDIYNAHSIRCSCGDGISYPEKLMESVLIQLNVDYERQYKIDKFRYDFYLSKHNIIIEVHGGQHYEECTRGRSLKEEQENDKLKEELALKNGIKHYIVIDCRESDLEYIKNNTLNSELNGLFDLSKVDWIKCGKFANSNLVKEVCDYYKEHQGIFTSDLAKEFGMSNVVIIKYLKQGTKLGWCKYNAKEEMKRRAKLNGKSKGKAVSQFTLEGEFIKTYPSVTEAERETGITNSNISSCCNGKHGYKSAGGYIWKYLNKIN